MTQPLPISRVRTDGQVELLGSWRSDSRELELLREGFPFLGPGRHRVEGELPWIFWDMCPSGYLGRRLQARMPSLHLAPNPRDWTATECLQALTLAGSDLSGNLLVGEPAAALVRGGFRFDVGDFAEIFEQAMRDSVLDAAPSSLGGERPKVLWSDGETAQLAKFAPPSTTLLGQRWSDLLRTEAHCAQTLRAQGVSAVHARARVNLGRTMLFVDRFDRLPGGGRRGAATLFWLSMDRYGEVNWPAPELLRRLRHDGLVDSAAVETCERVDAFSAALGNNDAHLGNYGLLFDDHGRASLAPIYDVLPMVLAPRNDELPDAYLGPRSTKEDPRVTPWVDQLAQLIGEDPEISLQFKAIWRRYVGR